MSAADAIEPMEALVDIRTLARVGLESDDMAVMMRDLEMILAIAETVLTSQSAAIKTAPPGAPE